MLARTCSASGNAETCGGLFIPVKLYSGNSSRYLRTHMANLQILLFPFSTDLPLTALASYSDPTPSVGRFTCLPVRFHWAGLDDYRWHHDTPQGTGVIRTLRSVTGWGMGSYYHREQAGKQALTVRALECTRLSRAKREIYA